jgi:diguanylate cyclase (GGDEF)-like protein
MAGVEADQPTCLQREPLEQLLALHEIALASMSHGLLLWNDSGRVELFNQRFVEMHGLSPAMVRAGMSVQELFAYSATVGNFPYITPEKAWRLLVERMAAGEPFSARNSFQNGSTVAAKCRPIPGGRWVGVYEDVTEQERLESALRLQAERTERAFTLMSHGLSMFDADERLIVANEQYYRIYGFDPAVVKPGVHLRELIAHAIECGSGYGKTLQETYNERRVGARGSGVTTAQLQLTNGRIIEITARSTSDGGWVSTHENITSRRQYEDELREQNQRLDLAHGLCVFDADEKLIVCNDQYLEYYDLDPAVVTPGVTHREVLAHWLSRGNHPGTSLEEFHQKRMRLVRSRETRAMLMARKDGRIIEATSRPAPNGGWVSAHEDVTDRLRQQEILREQNLRFDAALENMAQGLVMFDKDLRILVCNGRFLAMWNYDPAIVKTGTSLREMLRHSVDLGNHGPNYDLKYIYDRYCDRLKNRSSEVIRRDGDGRLIAVRTSSMANGGWVVTYEDVTEREQAAEILREQHLRFDAALDNMAQGLVMFDADLRILVCNRRYLEMFDFAPEVVKPGAALIDVIRHSVAIGNHDPNISAEDIHDRYVRRLGGTTVFRRRIDDRRILLSSRAMANGGWLATYDDVTERERGAIALREQNLRFDAALNNMSQGLCMFDAEHRLIVCNDRYLEIFRCDGETIKPGMTLRQVFEIGAANGIYSGLTADDLLESRRAMLGRNEPVVYDQKVGDGRTLSITICPMLNGGWVGTFEDITDRRKLEAERAAALTSLREQNLRFDAALNNMSQGLSMFDAEHRLIVCNDNYLKIFRADGAVVRPGATMHEIFAHGVALGIYPGFSVDELLARRMEVVSRRKLVSYDQAMADGRTVSVTICPMAEGGWVGTYEDVTESRRIEAERAAALEEVREQHQRFDAALSNMSHGLCMVGKDHRLIICNQRFIDMLGIPPGAIGPGASLRDVIAASVAVGNYPGASVDEAFERYLSQLGEGVHAAQRHLPDGRTLLITRRPMEGGGWVAIYEDITERRKAEERIAHMARHDALTGLPNRLLFREKMAEGLVRVESDGNAMAVLCLDLDHFKTVNDTLGHPVGDRLLSAVAERLIGVIGDGDTIARLGGDEFAILQPGPQPHSAEMLARRIVDVLDAPVILDGHEINTGASIGIAVAPSDGMAADHLIKCADLALYRAKADGRARYRFFEVDMDTRVQEKRTLEIDLRRALAAGEFELHYQPQVRAADCVLTGMEALLRWTHATRGPVPPSEFIPLAEETGLIIPLGEWVLRHACAEAAQWPSNVKVAVNLSPAQFKSRGLVAMVASALAVAGLAANRLELEITEAVLLRDDEMTLAMLHQLRALGVRISMDDFGTGYSSLSYLRSFPFDKIKIDRSFIADLDRGKDSAAIIRAIAGLGASLGIETTAEGVETAEQFERVRRDGCTEIQGYYFSPPRRAAEVFEVMARFRREKAVA